jgi:outer membrane protein insertion porin family
MKFARTSKTPGHVASVCGRAIQLAAVVCLILLLLAGSPWALAQQSQVEGQTVAQVRVVYESGQVVRERIPSLPLMVGSPFRFTEERETLRTLYRMGDYADIRVTALAASDGLEVNFIVKPNLYNNVITIEGLRPPPSEAAALASLRLPLGEPFRESTLRAGVVRLQDALEDDGFYDAKITWTLEPHPDSRQMNVRVSVSSGLRARAGALTLVNKTPYPDAELLRRLKISGKTEITSTTLSRSNERLRKFLVNQGYLGATGVITRGSYDPKSNGVPLNVAVTAGPRVRVEIEGARLSKSQQQKLIPIFEEGAVDEDLLQEGRRNIRDYFQRQGYFEADVDVRSQQQEEQGQRVITYDIKRGEHFRLAGVAFDGNKYFGRALLLPRLQLQPASFASPGRFSQQLLRSDSDSLRGLYTANGFRDVQVSSSVDDRYRDKKGNLFVTFHIVEGEQTRVASLELEGNQSIPTPKLMNVVGLTPGQPYSEATVASDRNNILAICYNDGYPDAAFREDVLPGEAPNTVRLIYHITEGERVEVSKVLLSGYVNTRRDVVERQVAIQPNGPLREGDVAKTQRQLYNLGVFNRVQIAPQDPNGTDPDKAVVVAVHEADRYTIGYGGGFEVQRIAGGSSNPNGTTIGASPRGILEISRNNMFGLAQTLSFKARASTLEYRVVLSYAADNIFSNRNLSLQLTGFADKTQDVDTFTSTRLEAGLQLVQKLSSSSSLLYRYFYRRVKAFNLAETISPEQIPLLSQPTLVSGFGLTYARDRRDDPADAKHGTFNTVDVSDALPKLGSGAEFFRGFFQNSSFHSFGRAFVFARSVRFGVEVPLGNTVGESTEFNPSQCEAESETEMTPSSSAPEIPLPERFFSGGGTSLRGFALNQAGPRDPCTGFPIGGLALLVFNQELRFPMRLPFVGSRLGGTVFYDGGNVYTNLTHISFAWKAPSLTDLNYFSHTVGFGLRYPTPVGPVRVDFGFQLNPASYQVYNTTTSTIQVYQVPHFEFSFNIGPVF